MGKILEGPLYDPLKNQVTEMNESFKVAKAFYSIQKRVEMIRNQRETLLRTVESQSQKWASMITVQAHSFIFYLWYIEKKTFCKWLLLNNSVYQVLGEASGGLRGLKAYMPEVWEELTRFDSLTFLNMSTNDENSLLTHKDAFKQESKRYEIIAYALRRLVESQY